MKRLVVIALIALGGCVRKGDVDAAVAERMPEPPRSEAKLVSVGDGWSMSVYTDPATGCQYLQSPYGLTPRIGEFVPESGVRVMGCRR